MLFPFGKVEQGKFLLENCRRRHFLYGSRVDGDDADSASLNGARAADQFAIISMHPAGQNSLDPAGAKDDGSISEFNVSSPHVGGIRDRSHF